MPCANLANLFATEMSHAGFVSGLLHSLQYSMTFLERVVYNGDVFRYCCQWCCVPLLLQVALLRTLRVDWLGQSLLPLESAAILA